MTNKSVQFKNVFLLILTISFCSVSAQGSEEMCSRIFNGFTGTATYCYQNIQKPVLWNVILGLVAWNGISLLGFRNRLDRISKKVETNTTKIDKNQKNIFTIKAENINLHSKFKRSFDDSMYDYKSDKKSLERQLGEVKEENKKLEASTTISVISALSGWKQNIDLKSDKNHKLYEANVLASTMQAVEYKNMAGEFNKMKTAFDSSNGLNDRLSTVEANCSNNKSNIVNNRLLINNNIGDICGLNKRIDGLVVSSENVDNELERLSGDIERIGRNSKQLDNAEFANILYSNNSIEQNGVLKKNDKQQRIIK
jgi:hypothetical protein